MIQRHLDHLCVQVSKFGSGMPVMNLGAAIHAFTRDVANEFILDKDYNSLDQDFDAATPHPIQEMGRIWRITKHVRWFGPALKAIPPNWVMKVADEGTKSFFGHLLVRDMIQ